MRPDYNAGTTGMTIRADWWAGPCPTCMSIGTLLRGWRRWVIGRYGVCGNVDCRTRHFTPQAKVGGRVE